MLCVSDASGFPRPVAMLCLAPRQCVLLMCLALAPSVIAAGGGDRRISVLPLRSSSTSPCFLPARAHRQRSPSSGMEHVDGRVKSMLLRDATVYAMTFSPSGDRPLPAVATSRCHCGVVGRLLSESSQLEGAVKALGFSHAGTELACATGKEVRLCRSKANSTSPARPAVTITPQPALNPNPHLSSLLPRRCPRACTQPHLPPAGAPQP